MTFDEISKIIREALDKAIQQCEICTAYKLIVDDAYANHKTSTYPDTVQDMWLHHANAAHRKMNNENSDT